MSQFARLTVVVIVATFSFHATGCESSSATRRAEPAARPAAQVSQQLIVKFKPGTVACNAQDIARFSKLAGARLEWLRAMSGDACVVTQTGSTSDELPRAQQRLKKHPDIEWVEIDAPMQRH